MASTLNSPQLELAKQIAEQYQIVIILIDDFGKIHWASPSLKAVFAYSLNDVVGQTIFQLCPELSLMDIKRSLKKGASIGLPSYFINKKGQTLPVALSKGRCSFGGTTNLCLLIEEGEAKRVLHEAILYMGQYDSIRESRPKLISIKKNTQKLPLTIKTINAVGSYKEVVDKAKELGGLSGAHVLIQGEKGTGKKSLAKQLSQYDRQKQGTFVNLNCQSKEFDIAKRLFGHLDDNQVEEGVLDEANGGILYLENIEELTLDIQDQILNVLLDNVFFRQGNKQPQSCQIRLIASTTIDLRRQIRSGLFHPALYRLFRNHIIHNPPLRKRKEQIRPLLRNFLNFYLKDSDVIDSIMKDVSLMEQFENHDYPDNINELKIVVKSLQSPQEGFERHPLLLGLKNKIG